MSAHPLTYSVLRYLLRKLVIGQRNINKFRQHDKGVTLLVFHTGLFLESSLYAYGQHARLLLRRLGSFLLFGLWLKGNATSVF